MDSLAINVFGTAFSVLVDAYLASIIASNVGSGTPWYIVGAKFLGDGYIEIFTFSFDVLINSLSLDSYITNTASIYDLKAKSHSAMLLNFW
ncbi:28840_t:CDS:2 [Dentiscutata erythropus]|uniref:28840_t:CDS:1 n=1 Tax=Dentiscutata erythropus TaxID=1348616 RepID=A0A9N9HN87_9GLOM|nr:28840_t:CDS:2 [Dentiscutata erythropus]